MIVAPSGAGKSSLVDALLKDDSGLKLSLSTTTRAPRPGEVDGKNYRFVSKEEFIQEKEQGHFLEWAEVHGHFYGTSRPWIESQMQAGSDVMLEIDWQGAAQVRQLYPEAISIFILPPSMQELQSRLRGRGQDSDEVITKRLAAAKDEMSHVGEFDYVTINDKFEESLQDLAAIIRTQRLKCTTQLTRHATLIKGLV